MSFSRNVCRCLCKQIFVFLIYIYICTINGFLLPNIQHSWFLKNRDSKKQTQKAWLSDIAIFFHVQIHCACQWIMTLPPKILWPTALLNTWNIITFPKSSFYHTNHTFLTNINVWMMDFWSINTRIKKISSAQNTILCREWLLQKLTFRHSEITIFNHSQNPTQRTFGEPQAPSVYIYICMFYVHKHITVNIYIYCAYYDKAMSNTTGRIAAKSAQSSSRPEFAQKTPTNFNRLLKIC